MQTNRLKCSKQIVSVDALGIDLMSQLSNARGMTTEFKDLAGLLKKDVSLRQG